jgi:hypothetical protein
MIANRPFDDLTLRKAGVLTRQACRRRFGARYEISDFNNFSFNFSCSYAARRERRTNRSTGGSKTRRALFR